MLTASLKGLEEQAAGGPPEKTSGTAGSLPSNLKSDAAARATASPKYPGLKPRTCEYFTFPEVGN